jgi:hypothetical protein
MKKLTIFSQVLVAILLLFGCAALVQIYRQSYRPAVAESPTVPPLATITFEEQVAMATAACGSPAKMDEKRTITCPVCPRDSDFSGTNAMPGGPGGWTADGAIAGHFTTSGADEALLHASGCESHAKNYGGDFLMRRVAGRWSTVRYAPGATADSKCQRLPWQEGRDTLICETADMHQGVASDAVQFLIFDATAPTGEDWKNTLFVATTDESSNCGYTPPRTLQFGRIDAVELLPADAGGKQDVAVRTTIARIPAPPEGTATCPKGEPHSYRIVFHNMGDHFEAAGDYPAVAALKRDDCCELTVNEKVRPGKY